MTHQDEVSALRALVEGARALLEDDEARSTEEHMKRLYWFREYYKLTGAHMVLVETDEYMDWLPPEMAATETADDGDGWPGGKVLDEINRPAAANV